MLGSNPVLAFIDPVLAMKNQHFYENQPKTLVFNPNLAQRRPF
jgi:hypothetical protein